MGKQDGLIQLTGSVGNLSFYKTQDGYLVRKKNGLSPNRIKSDPAFARTRENATEFARAGRAGKLVRSAFRPLLYSVADNRVTSRLTGAMVKVIKEDATNSRGERNVIHGETALLEGFEFNRKAALATIFDLDTTASIDRRTGNMVVSVPAFSPDKIISAPDGATHFRLKAGGAALDFAGNTYAVATTETADLSLSNNVQEPLQLSLTVTPGSVHPLFLIFGIEFSDVTRDGTRHTFDDAVFNAMAIVKIDHDVNKNILPDENTGEEKEEAPVSLVTEPEEQEVYQFSYVPASRFDQAHLVTYTLVQTNSDNQETRLSESTACSFTGNIHYSMHDTVATSTSLLTAASYETKGLTNAHVVSNESGAVNREMATTPLAADAAASKGRVSPLRVTGMRPCHLPHIPPMYFPSRYFPSQ